MDVIKNLIVEYILTNGTLPGFDVRFDETLEYWETSDEPFLVYRGHGSSKKGIKRLEGIAVNELKNSVRPIISTSKDKEIVIKKFTDYAEKKEGICCFFEITVEPGIRFIDFSKIPTDYFNINSIRTFMNMKKEIDPENKLFPNQKFPYSKLLDILKTRKDTEQEVILDGMQGTFTPVEDTENKANNGRPIRVIKLKYSQRKTANNNANNNENEKKGGNKYQKTRRQRKSRKTRKNRK
jgi:hypothetical protein